MPPGKRNGVIRADQFRPLGALAHSAEREIVLIRTDGNGEQPTVNKELVVRIYQRPRVQRLARSRIGAGTRAAVGGVNAATRAARVRNEGGGNFGRGASATPCEQPPGRTYSRRLLHRLDRGTDSLAAAALVLRPQICLCGQIGTGRLSSHSPNCFQATGPAVSSRNQLCPAGVLSLNSEGGWRAHSPSNSLLAGAASHGVLHDPRAAAAQKYCSARGVMSSAI